MSIQAQAGSVQATTARGGAQLLAVFVFLVALFVGLVGLAIAFRPAVAAPASDAATWSQTHPLMVDRGTSVAATPAILDRGADSFSGAASVSDTKVWLQTHPLMADRGVVVATDMSSAARAAFSSALAATNAWQQTHPVMVDRAESGAVASSINAATGFNLDQAAGTDMSAAARAALNAAVSTPVVNPYTGFNLSSAGSPAILDRGADR